MKREDVEMLEKKCTLYKKSKTPIHINVKNNVFYNGHIKEVSSDFMIIIDRKIGEMVVFFLEIEKLEPFTGDLND